MYTILYTYMWHSYVFPLQKLAQGEVPVTFDVGVSISDESEDRTPDTKCKLQIPAYSLRTVVLTRQ